MAGGLKPGTELVNFLDGLGRGRNGHVRLQAVDALGPRWH
jgi:hypothetical protein